MNKRAEVAVIRRLEAEYCPFTERFELEDWLASKLYDTYHNLLHDEDPDLFRFREAAILYVKENELINITRLVDKKVVEHCVLLSNFLKKNYGVKRLGNRADVEMELMLSESDFELMAMQIVDDLMEWYETMDVVSFVLDKKPKQQNP